MQLPPQQPQEPFPCPIPAFSCYSTSWGLGQRGSRDSGLGLAPQNESKACASKGLFSAGTCSLQLS